MKEVVPAAASSSVVESSSCQVSINTLALLSEDGVFLINTQRPADAQMLLGLHPQVPKVSLM